MKIFISLGHGKAEIRSKTLPFLLCVKGPESLLSLFIIIFSSASKCINGFMSITLSDFHKTLSRGIVIICSYRIESESLRVLSNLSHHMT